jgi:hypothetical protein
VTAPTTTKPFALSQEQLERLQSEDDFLRGTAALAIVSDAVKKAGIELPSDYIFKARDRNVIEKAAHATFHLLGGVPGMLLWAKHNPNQFYPLYLKMAPLETTIHASNFNIHTNVPDSPLDNVTIDATGQVVDAEVQDADDAPDV